MKAFYLKIPQGARFHFGVAMGVYPEEESNNRKISSEILHSDTLFSALVNAWALTCPDTLQTFIKECESHKFALSSAFYHVYNRANGKHIYFLPKPVTIDLTVLKNSADLKRLRKIEMISKGIWESGLHPEEWFNAEKCTLVQNDKYVALKSEMESEIRLYDMVTSPKVKVRSETREDAFYYQTDLFVTGDKHHSVDFYFLIKDELNDALTTDLYKSFHTMVHMGLGGERSTGCGAIECMEAFCFEFDSAMKPAQRKVSVSLIIPEVSAVDLHTGRILSAYYKTMKRGGRYLPSKQYLPMVQCLSEGSISDNLKGRVFELSADPPILRFGINMNLEIHENFINDTL